MLSSTRVVLRRIVQLLVLSLALTSTSSFEIEPFDLQSNKTSTVQPRKSVAIASQDSSGNTGTTFDDELDTSKPNFEPQRLANNTDGQPSQQSTLEQSKNNKDFANDDTNKRLLVDFLLLPQFVVSNNNRHNSNQQNTVADYLRNQQQALFSRAIEYENEFANDVLRVSAPETMPQQVVALATDMAPPVYASEPKYINSIKKSHSKIRKRKKKKKKKKKIKIVKKNNKSKRKRKKQQKNKKHKVTNYELRPKLIKKKKMKPVVVVKKVVVPKKKKKKKKKKKFKRKKWIASNKRIDKKASNAFYDFRSFPAKEVWHIALRRGNNDHLVQQNELKNVKEYKLSLRWRDPKGRGNHLFELKHI